MKNVFILLFFTIFLCLPRIGLAVGEQPGQNEDFVLEVFQMTQSLDELISTLKSEQIKRNEFQKLQAAIAYLSFRSRSIEATSAELRFKEEQRSGIESSIEKIESDPEEWEKRFAVFRPNSSPAGPGQPKQSEIRLQMLQERLKDLNGDILQLETEILTAKNELASFESFVQSKIGLIE